MFVCHKCGKILVSKQAYTYHLNRKKPCSVKHPCGCGEEFNTKFDLYIHQIHCESKASHVENVACKVVMSGDNVVEVFVGNHAIPAFTVEQKSNLLEKCTPKANLCP